MKLLNMLTTNFSLGRVAFVAAASLVLAQSAWAGASKDVVDHYTAACEQMAQMGTAEHHFGDWDIKDNPKFHAYCGCFGQKFGDRAVTKTGPLHNQEEIKAAQAEELDMRNTCRNQFGLPAVPPKKAK